MSTNPTRAVKPHLLKNTVRFPQLHAHTTHPPTTQLTHLYTTNWILTSSPSTALSISTTVKIAFSATATNAFTPNTRANLRVLSPTAIWNLKKTQWRDMKVNLRVFSQFFAAKCGSHPPSASREDQPAPTGGRNFRRRL